MCGVPGLNPPTRHIWAIIHYKIELISNKTNDHNLVATALYLHSVYRWESNPGVGSLVILKMGMGWELNPRLRGVNPAHEPAMLPYPLVACRMYSEV